MRIRKKNSEQWSNFITLEPPPAKATQLFRKMFRLYETTDGALAHLMEKSIAPAFVALLKNLIAHKASHELLRLNLTLPQLISLTNLCEDLFSSPTSRSQWQNTMLKNAAYAELPEWSEHIYQLARASRHTDRFTGDKPSHMSNDCHLSSLYCLMIHACHITRRFDRAREVYEDALQDNAANNFIRTIMIKTSTQDRAYEFLTEVLSDPDADARTCQAAENNYARRFTQDPLKKNSLRLFASPKDPVYTPEPFSRKRDLGYIGDQRFFCSTLKKQEKPFHKEEKLTFSSMMQNSRS